MSEAMKREAEQLARDFAKLGDVDKACIRNSVDTLLTRQAMVSAKQAEEANAEEV